MARPLLVLLVAAGVGAAEPVDFNRDVRPILNEKCMGCHGGVKHAGGISVQYREDILGKGESGEPCVVPGKPEQSELIRRILTDDHDDRMPKEKPPLTKAETDTLIRWVKEGAKWDDHWSLVAPKPSPAPTVKSKNWASNPVDNFILARLEQAGLKPSAQADKTTLLRRVTLDLTGLPPTSEETAAFLADKSPEAYEKVVDRLLASPRFGERWAAMWLDLVRYGDSKALGHDSTRHIWPYRDWIIRAFNQDMPWDQFIIRQMAGDLLPEPERDLVATGFHRLTKANDEGGTNDEEYRTYAVIDRVNTTWNAFMGLQMACTQCHSHPYDPLRDKDYYGSYAFLNQSQDSDKQDDRPTIPFPVDPAAERRLRAAIAEAEKAGADKQPSLVWTELRASRLVASGGAVLTAQADGLLRASGPRPNATVSEVDLSPGALRQVAAVAVDIPAGPGKPAGRHPDGNFVLSAVEVSRIAPTAGFVAAQRLRIDIPGKGKVVNLSEIEVLDPEGRNVALNAKAAQSSTSPGYPASIAVNGKRSTGIDDTSSTNTQDNPWLEIDLGAPRTVAAIRLWNRMDAGNDARITGAIVSLLAADGRPVWSRAIPLRPTGQLVELTVDRAEFALPLARAEAGHSQNDYPASAVLANGSPATTGWAVGPRVNEPHRLTLALAEPTALAPGEQIRVRLHHAHAKRGFAGMDLAVFKVVATDSPAAAANAPLGTLAKLRQQLEKLPTVRLPVMMDLPQDKRRQTHLLVRGAWNSPGQLIAEPFTPATLHPFPKDQPRDRLGFARWIASKDNPLTARVAVNYLWQELFGTGLVLTSEDFGTMGEKPSHPELLDHLAHRLMHEWGWSPKRAIREMTLSSTYRQTSQASAELRERDPKNRLLGRAPRKRLSGEMVRDQSLALAGLLNTAQTEGPPFVPPSPGGYLRNAFSGASEVRVTTDAGRFRRSVYGFWKRLEPFAILTIFDASDRDTCATRRVNTNSPLQALTALNEEILVEAQKGFGRRLLQEPGDDAAKVRAGFTLVGETDPRPESMRAATGLLLASRQAYAADPELARKAGLTPEEASWWQVATVLLNSDTALNRN